MAGEGFPEVDVFSWVRRTVFGEAACVTLVQSRDMYSVARGFGGDPGNARRLPLRAAENESLRAARPEFGDDPWVGVRTVGSWVLAVEVNGWQGSRPEVLERISSGTRAVSTYWSPTVMARFSYAAAGRVLTTFDGVFPGRRFGDDPDGLEAVRAGFPWDDGDDDDEVDPVLLILALAARVTGNPARPAWFDGTFDIILVEPVLA